MAKDQGKEKFNFHEAFSELEKINDWFSKDDIDLDEALDKFRRGADLIRTTKKKLKDVENEFEKIQKSFDAEEDSLEF